MKVSTTLKDYGRTSKKFGDIPTYYVFKYKFYVVRHDLKRSEAQDWCRENCKGYYRVDCYTHMTDEQMYVDKVYLQNEQDAFYLKMTFDVTDEFIRRERKRKPRAVAQNKLAPQRAAKDPRRVAAARKAWVTMRARQSRKNNFAVTTSEITVQSSTIQRKLKNKVAAAVNTNQTDANKTAIQHRPGTIEWTEKTWNPIAGCTVISPGCTNCYAMRMAARCSAMGQQKYDGTTRMSGGRSVWTGQINFDENSLHIPERWKSPTVIFVNSMSDLFHDDVQLEWQKMIFDVMNKTPRHTYQVLTKRPANLYRRAHHFTWSENIWMGVTVESQDYVDRIPLLRATPAKIKFLSLEPLLSPLPNLNLSGIDWVIAGGESGPGARVDLEEMADWYRDIRDQCIRAQIPFHFKQWGGVFKKRNGRELDGRTWDDLPDLGRR